MDPIYLDARESKTRAMKKYTPRLTYPEILKYPRYQVEPLDNVDGRRKKVKARKRAMAGTAAATKPTADTPG